MRSFCAIVYNEAVPGLLPLWEFLNLFPGILVTRRAIASYTKQTRARKHTHTQHRVTRKPTITVRALGSLKMIQL